jgi:hypothetical protein
VTLQHGHAYCGSCALDFTAALFEPPESPRPQPRALEGGAVGEARCARHARNAAAATCERCGAFMCALCRIDSDGKVLCAACFDRLRGEGALQSARTSFRSWRTLGLHLSIVGFFVSPLGIVIGPAALVATIRGIAQDRKSGDEGGRASAVVALVLGVLVTLAGVFVALSLGGALHHGRH